MLISVSTVVLMMLLPKGMILNKLLNWLKVNKLLMYKKDSLSFQPLLNLFQLPC